MTKSERIQKLMLRSTGATMKQMQAAIGRDSFISLARHVPKGHRLVKNGSRYHLVARGKAAPKAAETRAQA